MQRVKIITFAPPESADAVRKALGEAGAGTLGKYTFCSFTTIGNGRFLPSVGANPHIGRPGMLEVVTEERIEVVCDRAMAREVINVLKKAHPYEEVAFDIIPLIREEDL